MIPPPNKWSEKYKFTSTISGVEVLTYFHNIVVLGTLGLMPCPLLAYEPTWRARRRRS